MLILHAYISLHKTKTNVRIVDGHIICTRGGEGVCVGGAGGGFGAYPVYAAKRRCVFGGEGGGPGDRSCGVSAESASIQILRVREGRQHRQRAGGVSNMSFHPCYTDKKPLSPTRGGGGGSEHILCTQRREGVRAYGGGAFEVSVLVAYLQKTT